MVLPFCRFNYPKKQPNAPELSGRIRQAFEDVDQMSNQLESIKLELSKDPDDDLIPLVKEVIDPLLRDAGKIQKAANEEEAIKKYQEWTDRARMWMQIYTNKGDKLEVVQALAKHVIQRCFERIDRDILFIHDYIVQHVNSLFVNPNDRISTKNRLLDEVSPFLDKLASLKTSPKNDSLSEISKWKASLDSKRDKFLHSSLHTIDETIL